MRYKLLASSALMSAMVLGALWGPGAFAQSTNPPYLADFPSVDKVMSVMRTASPDESASRQAAAFVLLVQMITQMSGPRAYQRGAAGGFTADENKLRLAYDTALDNLEKADPKAALPGTAMSRLQFSPQFHSELVQKLFPPTFSADSSKAMAQARAGLAQVHQNAVRAAEAREAANQPAEEKALAELYQRFQAQQQEAHMDPQTREMRRCITAGRVLAVCVGNGLMGSLMPNVNGMLSSVAPGAVGKEVTGPQMAGVFTGNGWRLEFSGASVSLSCQGMIPDSHAYRISFVGNRAVLDIANVPQDVLLAVAGDTLVGSGPATVHGRVAGGVYTGQDPYSLTARRATIYRYVLVTESCPKPVLSKTNRPGMVGTQQNVLMGMFNNGDSGPPTPAGLRMNGSYAAAGGFSVEFFPESAILGCGPDVARAYPYTVVADGRQSEIKVAAPDHPLTLLIRPNGVLDPGSGAYQVEGRRITGEGAANGDYTFAPLDATCSLAPLSPGPIPSAPVPTH
jgi:hypothetical protein